ncbi:ABC transporter ATP-binding protein [Paeniglutamicibacter cryotolerans]|uniref:ABC-2 type transport system ATP-binding protein n=1 Tax=Paeniglutamicibacter cryotolerans TaxID=670079 RepID=A0A839QLI7_9MICC|nr:ABC transporter ATP-binding protein [Paeniglutamicibacter cryotolerans]MBB2995624.1 ABC-2 type transport system ATP-binding protein [Paeniglutamicibacter cryotolerans]
MNEASGDLAISTRGLSKAFGKRRAVNSIDLAVPHGSVFGFLGPNGSGKTTTIRMLLGLAAPGSGEITLLGQSMPGAAARVLPRVGAMVEGPAFYPFLSGRANLLRFDAANRSTDPRTSRRRIDAALERVGLAKAAKLAVHAYSLGMKQRLGIANALSTERDLLILDEPTNGLDPQGTREVRNIIAGLAAEGRTIFVSSHLLSEIEQICTHVAVMSVGTLVAQGTLQELRASGSSRITVLTPDAAVALAVLESLGLEPRSDGPGSVGALYPEGSAAPEDIVAALVAARVRVRGFSSDRSSLEQRFVELTGEGFNLAQ